MLSTASFVGWISDYSQWYHCSNIRILRIFILGRAENKNTLFLERITTLAARHKNSYTLDNAGKNSSLLLVFQTAYVTNPPPLIKVSNSKNCCQRKLGFLNKKRACRLRISEKHILCVQFRKPVYMDSDYFLFLIMTVSSYVFQENCN